MAYPAGSYGALQRISDMLEARVHVAHPVSDYPLGQHELLERIAVLIEAGATAPSAGGASASYIHVQSSPSPTWTINHNLGHRPNVSLMNSGGMEIDGDVVHLSENVIIASFGMPVAGTARCL